MQGGGPGGIAVRRDCTDDARTGTSVLNDRTEVNVTAVGVGRCSGWSMVRASDGETWIRDAYLLIAPTPTATATAAPVATKTESTGSPVVGLVVLAAIGGGIFWLVKRTSR